MQHIILTRFNVASPGKERVIRNAPGWLSRRFDLFETYCLPSVAAQKGSDFEWMIYFDISTPAEFRERISRCQEIYRFNAMFVEMLELSVVKDDVQTFLRAETSRLLTTRLDNDDAISSDYLEMVRQAALGCNDGTVINFNCGMAISSGRVFTANDRSNPFASLIEGRSRFETIWGAPHHLLADKWAVMQIDDTPPMWLQAIHDENVANRVKGRRINGLNVTERFALSPDFMIERYGVAAKIADRLFWYPVRLFRETAIRQIKRIVGSIR